MIEFRSYEPRDRDGVRSICVKTAFYGRDLSEWIDFDPRAFADIFVSYHTDYEPETLWLAVDEGRPVAYVTLSLDPERQSRVFLMKILPGVFLKLLTGEYRLGNKVFLVLMRWLSDYFKYGWLKIPVDECPVEVHMNMLEGYRGSFRIWREFVKFSISYLIERDIYYMRALMLQRRTEFESKMENLGFKTVDSIPTTIRGRGEYEGRFYSIVADFRKWFDDYPGAFRLFGIKSEELGIKDRS